MPIQLKKLDHAQTGQYMVTHIINQIPYTLELPYMIPKPNLFYSSLINFNTPHNARQAPSKPQPTDLPDSEEWELNRILDSK